MKKATISICAIVLLTMLTSVTVFAGTTKSFSESVIMLNSTDYAGNVNSYPSGYQPLMGCLL